MRSYMKNLFDEVSFDFEIKWDYHNSNYVVKTVDISSDPSVYVEGKNYQEALTNFGVELEKKFKKAKSKFKKLSKNDVKELTYFKNTILKFYQEIWFKNEFLPKILKSKNIDDFEEINQKKWKYKNKFEKFNDDNNYYDLFDIICKFDNEKDFFVSLDKNWASKRELIDSLEKKPENFILNSDNKEDFFENVYNTVKLIGSVTCINCNKPFFYLKLDNIGNDYNSIKIFNTAENYIELFSEFGKKLQDIINQFEEKLDESFFESPIQYSFFTDKSNWHREDFIELSTTDFNFFNCSIDEFFYKDKYYYVLIRANKYFIINENDSNQLKEKLNANLTINIEPKIAFGLDGTTYTLKIKRTFNYVKLQWWSDSAGKGWKNVYKIRDQIKNIIEKYTKEKIELD